MSAHTHPAPVDHKRAVGNAIRVRRQTLELTQAELAEKILILLRRTNRRVPKFDARNVSRWERGANTPTGRHLQIVAEALDTTVADLLGAQTPPEPPDVAELRRLLARIDRRLQRIERQLASRNGSRVR